MSHQTTLPAEPSRRGRNRALGAIAAGLAVFTLAAGTTFMTVRSDAIPADDSASRPVETLSTGSLGSDTERDTSHREGQGGTSERALHRYGEVANPAGTTNWASMQEFMEFVIQDADAYWTGVMIADGRPEPRVTYRIVLPNEIVDGACGQIRGNENNSYYCSADDTIYLIADFARKLWDGSYVRSRGWTSLGGDFAVAWLVAHEFAHSLQQEVGILSGRFTEFQTEQHADCWAGVWARSAESRNLLDPGDIEEGLYAAWGLGNPEQGTHGTPQQRWEAFAAGYVGGIGSTCDVFIAG